LSVLLKRIANAAFIVLQIKNLSFSSVTAQGTVTEILRYLDAVNVQQCPDAPAQPG
jgi:hypothetical protein